MIILVIGGVASGKSACAEEMAEQLAGSRSKLYIATLQPYDSETLEKIKKHRLMRANARYDTMEIYDGNLSKYIEQSNRYGVILFECVSNLVANIMFNNGTIQKVDTEKLLKEFKILSKKVDNLVIVTNEIFSGTDFYDDTVSGATKEYISTLAKLNRTLAIMADKVVETTCGLQITHKSINKVEKNAATPCSGKRPATVKESR